MKIKDPWADLVDRYHLSDEQLVQFKIYARCLQTAKVNVTALRELSDIVYYHFADSLEARMVLPWDTIRSYADVGTGGGLPGIALHIMAPHTTAILLEVVGKKRNFLHSVVAELGLRNVIIDERDWRTFLRTSQIPLDLVCSRAALPPRELLRMFQPTSPYRHASLLYWASHSWEPTEEEQPFVQQEHRYHIDTKLRKLILLRQFLC